MPTPERTTRKEIEQRRATLVSHKTRGEIVAVMRSYGRPISPTQLARITGKSLGSTSYHVRTLASAGIVELADEGRVRGAVEHFYALVADEDEGQLADPLGQLLALCGVLTLPSEEGGFPQLVTIDDEGRQELRGVLDRLKPRVRKIAVASQRRSSGR